MGYKSDYLSEAEINQFGDYAPKSITFEKSANPYEQLTTDPLFQPYQIMKALGIIDFNYQRVKPRKLTPDVWNYALEFLRRPVVLNVSTNMFRRLMFHPVSIPLILEYNTMLRPLTELNERIRGGDMRDMVVIKDNLGMRWLVTKPSHKDRWTPVIRTAVHGVEQAHYWGLGAAIPLHKVDNFS